MITGYRVMKCLPWPFHMIHPRRVNRLVNYPELGICFQPALCFAAFMDNVVINDQRDCFRPPVSDFQVLQQSDKQR